MRLSNQIINEFACHLRKEEKSPATMEKYLRDVRAFYTYIGDQEIDKENVIAWKKHLMMREYAVRSVNSMLASVNSLLDFLGLHSCKIKSIRVQRRIYCTESKELTRSDYLRLLKASMHNERLNLVLQTICSTGIRVSELQYFTVEAIKVGEVTVDCKNKTRTILVPGKLKKLLSNYAKKHGIRSGAIFVTRSGKTLNRSNIWAAMKKLCKVTGVALSKVFPHNLRKLFARTFYGVNRDIAKLSDILGHSSIDTTRIYIMTSGIEHRRIIERLGLVICEHNIM